MTFLDLPAELLYGIVRYFETSGDVHRLALVCTALWALVDDGEIARKDAEYHEQDHVKLLRPIRNQNYDYNNNNGGRRPPPAVSEPLLHWVIANGADIARIGGIVRSLLVCPTPMPGTSSTSTSTSTSLSSSSPSSRLRSWFWYVLGDWNTAWPSPLIAAITSDRRDVVELLLVRRPSPSSSPSFSSSSREGSEAAAEEEEEEGSLEIPGIIANGTLRADWDPLWHACDLGREPIAHLLLDAGAAAGEGHMVSAALRRLPRVLQRIINLNLNLENTATTTTGGGGASLSAWTAARVLAAAARAPDDEERSGGANAGAIDAVMTAAPAALARADGGHQLWMRVFAAHVLHGRPRNALYLWGVYAREHLGRPGADRRRRLPRDLAAFATGSDALLDMTRDLLTRYPFALLLPPGGEEDEEEEEEEAEEDGDDDDDVQEDAGGMEEQEETWTAGDELLLAAALQLRAGRNRKTIEYLVGAGCQASARHLEKTVEVSNIEALDYFVVEQGVDLSGQWPGMTLVQYAIQTQRWCAAFRLIHHHLCSGPSFPFLDLPREVKLGLWDEAQRVFVKGQSLRPLPLERIWPSPQQPQRQHQPDLLLPMVRFNSYSELLDFTAQMMMSSSQTSASSATLPIIGNNDNSRELFGLRGDKMLLGDSEECGQRIILTQLWALLRLVLGDNFLEISRRLVTGRVSLADVCP